MWLQRKKAGDYLGEEANRIVYVRSAFRRNQKRGFMVRRNSGGVERRKDKTWMHMTRQIRFGKTLKGEIGAQQKCCHSGSMGSGTGQLHEETKKQKRSVPATSSSPSPKSYKLKGALGKK